MAVALAALSLALLPMPVEGRAPVRHLDRVEPMVSARAMASPGERAVAVRILDRSAPAEVLVEGRGRVLLLAARGGALLRDGAASAQPLTLPAARWRVRIPDEPDREYVGALEVRAQEGVVRVALLLPLERYVARVVASETEPGTPTEALRAQAVVVRSFALAARGRHAGDRLCDLAHCQVLRGHGLDPGHAAAAAEAARATAGEVLLLPSGRVAEGAYHGACGGHTADPLQAFGGDASGAAAVADPGCSGPEWGARVPEALFLRVARERFAAASPERPFDSASLRSGRMVATSASDLTLVRGTGGWVVQVAARGGARTGGDGFARALDGALGWGQVRSSRFQVAFEPGAVRLHGSGLGHGVGLCQAGAAGRARNGEPYRAILRHYFPHAVPGSAISHPGGWALPGRSPGPADRAAAPPR